MSKKKVLITDIDNTLFDWFDMWYLSFTTLIDDVQSATGIDRDTLLAQSKTIHQTHGTSEYLFLLDELPAAAAIPPEHLNTLKTKYYATRDAGLKLYPTVMETLEQLKLNGVRIIAFSESKKFYSAYRLAKLGLNAVVDHLYCPDNHVIPSELERTAMFDDSRIVTLPRGFKKPDPQILLRIAKQEGVSTQQCLYVGDSETKDIEMAQRAEMDYAWFKSGSDHLTTRVTEYNLLRKITHWNPEAVAKEEQALTPSASSNVTGIAATVSSPRPDRTIYTFDQILNFI
jgi:FMN phosphatase YigB (HAD superfamily)